MLNVWSLSVRRRENDPPDHFLTLLHLEFMGSDHGNGVLPHQMVNPAMSDTHPHLVQLCRHPGPAIAAQTGPMLATDMRQQHQVTPLPLRWRPVPPGSKAPIRDAHKAAAMLFGKQAAIIIQESELHGFWAAKNCVAFFSSSLSSLRIQGNRVWDLS